MTKEKILGKFIDILPEFNLKSESIYRRIVSCCLKESVLQLPGGPVIHLPHAGKSITKLIFHFIPTKKPARVTSRFKFYFLTEFPSALAFFVSRSR